MDKKEFRKYAHQLVDWMADYLEEKEKYPVTPSVKPREIYDQLPSTAPEKGEAFEKIFQDFQEIILPGMTHWQHPAFFGYFPANNSEPSILAEMLMSTLVHNACLGSLLPPLQSSRSASVIGFGMQKELIQHGRESFTIPQVRPL